MKKATLQKFWCGLQISNYLSLNFQFHMVKKRTLSSLTRWSTIRCAQKIQSWSMLKIRVVSTGNGVYQIDVGYLSRCSVMVICCIVKSTSGVICKLYVYILFRKFIQFGVYKVVYFTSLNSIVCYENLSNLVFKYSQINKCLNCDIHHCSIVLSFSGEWSYNLSARSWFCV